MTAVCPKVSAKSNDAYWIPWQLHLVTDFSGTKSLVTEEVPSVWRINQKQKESKKGATDPLERCGPTDPHWACQAGSPCSSDRHRTPAALGHTAPCWRTRSGAGCCSRCLLLQVSTACMSCSAGLASSAHLHVKVCKTQRLSIKSVLFKIASKNSRKATICFNSSFRNFPNVAILINYIKYILSYRTPFVNNTSNAALVILGYLIEFCEYQPHMSGSSMQLVWLLMVTSPLLAGRDSTAFVKVCRLWTSVLFSHSEEAQTPIH